MAIIIGIIAGLLGAGAGYLIRHINGNISSASLEKKAREGQESKTQVDYLSFCRTSLQNAQWK